MFPALLNCSINRTRMSNSSRRTHHSACFLLSPPIGSYHENKRKHNLTTTTQLMTFSYKFKLENLFASVIVHRLYTSSQGKGSPADRKKVLL